ncbi:MAG: carbonate dehydratase [Amoebophilaceae bacterium]|nr:carbonate dehydratase [Amoebophilaceae bacterium]
MIDLLFENNKAWSLAIQQEIPDFFERLANQQNPDYLWMGCSDSRVPANQIVGLLPGDIFVHRNIANLVIHTDLNCLSVIQYAVDVLKVKHIMVVGHYNCGGVKAALDGVEIGLVDNWLRHVQDVKQKHIALFEQLSTEGDPYNLLCKLNVMEQVVNLCQTTMVQAAWKKQQPLMVHGWIYQLNDGILQDLEITIQKTEEVSMKYKAALGKVAIIL